MFFHYILMMCISHATGMIVIPSHTKIPHTLQSNLFQLPSVAVIGPFMVLYKRHLITMYDFSFVI